MQLDTVGYSGIQQWICCKMDRYIIDINTGIHRIPSKDTVRYMYMYVCKDSAAPAHAGGIQVKYRRDIPKIHARGGLPLHACIYIYMCRRVECRIPTLALA